MSCGLLSFSPEVRIDFQTLDLQRIELASSSAGDIFLNPDVL